MSGIGAIFQFDGGPVDSGALSRMAVHLKPRGPDGVRTWTTPGIGLVHAHFWTTPEDVGEEQPICSPCGRHWIVADARLDNRDDLLAALDSVTRSSTDAEIILAAYDKWGDDCGAKLEGDFGFVIWDAPQRRVLAVREPIGTRLLHYASVPGGLVIGSTSGAVVAALDRVPDQNRPYIHDYLQGRMSRWTTETPHQGVFRLMQSYALTATASGYRTRRYYVIGESRPEPWRNREEAAEQFTALFERAVRATLRIRTPAAILLIGDCLSGGQADCGRQGCRASLWLFGGLSKNADGRRAPISRRSLAELRDGCADLGAIR